MTTLKSLSELGALLGNGKTAEAADATFPSKVPLIDPASIRRSNVHTIGARASSDLVAVDPEPPRAA